MWSFVLWSYGTKGREAKVVVAHAGGLALEQPQNKEYAEMILSILKNKARGIKVVKFLGERYQLNKEK